MLQILTVCGAGLGSSFACQMSVDAVLKELGVEAKLDHTDISSVGGAKADIILSGKNFEKQFERYTLDCPTIFSIAFSTSINGIFSPALIPICVLPGSMLLTA